MKIELIFFKKLTKKNIKSKKIDDSSTPRNKSPPKSMHEKKWSEFHDKSSIFPSLNQLPRKDFWEIEDDLVLKKQKDRILDRIRFLNYEINNICNYYENHSFDKI